MILTNEDYDRLTQIQLLLAQIIKNAVMSEIEEENERRFEKLLNGGSAQALPLGYNDEIGFFEITEQEILKMPKTIRKHFIVQGKKVHYRIRQDNRYKKSYEVRFAKKPFNKPPISVSATTLPDLKAKFIERLKNYIVQEETTAPAVPKNFDGFAMFWFEKFHKRKTSDRTYDHDIKLYNRHIKDNLGKFAVKDLTAVMLQNFLDRFSDRAKTAKDMFECAVKNLLDY